MKCLKVLSLTLILCSCVNLKNRNLASGSKSVLYIGDSQTAGPLGALVYKHLQANFRDDQIRLFGVGSSSPRHWGSNSSSPQFRRYKEWLCSNKRKGRVNLESSIPTQESFCKRSSNESIFAQLNHSKPDHVIFQFLGNSMKMSPADIVNRIYSLLNELESSQRCLWITSPPFYRDAEAKFLERNRVRAEVEDLFVETIGDRCEVFRGMKGENWERFATTYEYYYTMNSQGRVLGDGMHFNKRGAQVFYESFKNKLP